MELETVMNYIANSTNLDGIRAEEIKRALALDVVAELGHGQILARRIKTVGGVVPGSMNFQARPEIAGVAVCRISVWQLVVAKSCRSMRAV